MEESTGAVVGRCLTPGTSEAHTAAVSERPEGATFAPSQDGGTDAGRVAPFTTHPLFGARPPIPPPGLLLRGAAGVIRLRGHRAGQPGGVLSALGSATQPFWLPFLPVNHHIDAWRSAVDELAAYVQPIPGAAGDELTIVEDWERERTTEEIVVALEGAATGRPRCDGIATRECWHPVTEGWLREGGEAVTFCSRCLDAELADNTAERVVG